MNFVGFEQKAVRLRLAKWKGRCVYGNGWRSHTHMGWQNHARRLYFIRINK